jgi:hypothetical protein
VTWIPSNTYLPLLRRCFWSKNRRKRFLVHYSVSHASWHISKYLADLHSAFRRQLTDNIRLATKVSRSTPVYLSQETDTRQSTAAFVVVSCSERPRHNAVIRRQEPAVEQPEAPEYDVEGTEVGKIGEGGKKRESYTQRYLSVRTGLF